MALALFGAAVIYTDRPEFCTSCHEMQPYYDAWASGPHSDTWCVDCHVGRGAPERVMHKFASLKEVMAHFTGDTSFPQPEMAELPAGTCKSCHGKPKVTTMKGFDHELHASQGACQKCHQTSGHVVTAGALRNAGIYNGTVQQASLTTAKAKVNGGAANIRGHVSVVCSRCHNMKASGCQTCHKAGHEDRGTCDTCHKLGARWAFAHSSDLDCTKCHTPPSKHFQPKSGTLPACSNCHKQAGRNWAFAHPNSSANCRDCHTPPANHPGQDNCTSCHRQGISFAFSHPRTEAEHPISGIACAKCHPSGYNTYTCTCHKDGTAEGGEGGEGGGGGEGHGDGDDD
jgi:hypothetical protein